MKNCQRNFIVEMIKNCCWYDTSDNNGCEHVVSYIFLRTLIPSHFYIITADSLTSFQMLKLVIVYMFVTAQVHDGLDRVN